MNDDLGAVFRPELRAAQSEVKEDMKIQRGPYRPARPNNWPTQTWAAEAPANEGKGDDTKEGPPLNSPAKGGGKKGKGKGKKGRFGRR